MNLIFKTYYGEKEKQNSEPGSPIKKEYQLRYDKDGKLKLEEVGETNLQEYIDSFASSVDLSLVLERLRNGDASVLEKAKGFYADVSELPVKLQDVLNLNIKGQEFFKTLPQEYQSLYGYDFQEFLYNPKKLIDYIESRPEILKEKVNANDDEE